MCAQDDPKDSTYVIAEPGQCSCCSTTGTSNTDPQQAGSAVEVATVTSNTDPSQDDVYKGYNTTVNQYMLEYKIDHIFWLPCTRITLDYTLWTMAHGLVISDSYGLRVRCQLASHGLDVHQPRRSGSWPQQRLRSSSGSIPTTWL